MADKGSGTQRGYDWAVDNDITSQQQVDMYTGPSSSFKAGMQKRVDEIAAALAKQNSNKTPEQPNDGKPTITKSNAATITPSTPTTTSQTPNEPND